jgi:hypothetical protein
MNRTMECPYCAQRHDVSASLRLLPGPWLWWYGDLARPNERFAVAWCPDAGCEVGGWIAETEQSMRHSNSADACAI